MKKFLSLMMALIMTMSLVVVGASAADFQDDDEITYVEAVDVLTALKVIDGYADGSFGPSGTLTRGAAAKIICNLILTPEVAGSLPASSAPFPDVPATHTFAGYIAYCANQGIINGYGDGTFRPADTLTGYAFMKMLLGALGYDSAIEGFTGANWAINVAKIASGIGLTNDLESSFTGTAAIKREEACDLAFETLKARLVEYDNPGSVISTGDVTITTRPSKAKYIEWAITTVSGNTDGKIGKADGFVQFAERYYTRLEKDRDQDVFGRWQDTWSYKGKKIGTYLDNADASYVGKVTYADIYADCGLTTTNNDFAVYIDGVLADDFDKGVYTYKTIEVKKGDEDTKIGTGNGCLVDVYVTDVHDGTGVISVRNVYVGEVIAKEKASGKTPASIEIAPVISTYPTVEAKNNSVRGVAVLDNGKFETEDFEVGDIVTFNYSLQGSKGSIKNVAAAEKVSGTLDSFSSNKKFSVSGTSYKYGKMAANYFNSNNVKTSVNVYLDANGFAMYFDEGEDNLKNYALVRDAAAKSTLSGVTKGEAYLIFSDGTSKVVDTDKAYYDGADDLRGEWVTYRTNSKGEYVLTEPAGTHVKNFSGAPTGSGITGPDGKSFVVLDGGKYRINSATQILVRGGNNKIRVYEGVKNLPKLTGGTLKFAVYTANGSDYAKLVYIETAGTTISDGSSRVMFIVSSKTATPWDNAENLYYEFDAVVDGKIAEDGVMLDYNDSATRTLIDTYLATKKNEGLLTTNYSVDGGVYSLSSVSSDNTKGGSTTSLKVASSVDRVTGTSIKFDSGTYVLADDCVFFRVNVHGDLEETQRAALRTATSIGGSGDYYNQVVYSLNNDVEITGVYWVVNK